MASLFFCPPWSPRISAVAFHYCPKRLTAQPRIFPAQKTTSIDHGLKNFEDSVRMRYGWYWLIKRTHPPSPKIYTRPIPIWVSFSVSCHDEEKQKTQTRHYKLTNLSSSMREPVHLVSDVMEWIIALFCVILGILLRSKSKNMLTPLRSA